MKNRFILFSRIIFSLSILISVSALGQTAATKKVLLALQRGEKIINNESCIEVNYTANQLQLVTKVGDNIYYYENGKRNGPYKSFEDVKTKDCGNNGSNECAAYKPDQSATQYDFITYTETGGMAIKFKDKTYGPYKMIVGIHMPKDQSWFVALVIKDGKYFIVSPGAAEKPVEGNGTYLHVSSIGKKYLVVCKEGEGMDAEMLNSDFSNMTQEQLMAMVQKQAEKQKNAGPPKAFIYNSEGKKFGPFPANNITDNNPAFCKTGGENWYMVIDNNLYINGVNIKQFSYDDVSAGTCNVWLSPNGKSYAIVTYNKILFSDGTTYAAPLKLDTESKEGKTFLKWISLENEENIVAYSKEL